MPQLLAKGVLILVFLALILGASAQEPGRAGVKPQRVASINLCADQLLLALADRDQIASLSPLVRDESISFLAGEARGLPTNPGNGEAILFSRADLVLAGRYDPQARLALLQDQGLDVMVLEPWRSLQQGREQIRALARRLGHPARGERLIESIDAALARADGIAPRGRSILVYHRRGWVPAAQSVTNEILAHMGFASHQETLGLPRGGLARLESIVQSPPDYALVDEVGGGNIDQGSALLAHPALIKAIPPERRLAIPSRLLICGGPSTPAAIDALAGEAREKAR